MQTMKHVPPSVTPRVVDSPSSNHYNPRTLKSTIAAIALTIGSVIGSASAQTTILATQSGGGALPAGWTSINNVTANAIDKTTYWHLEAGTTKDYIVSGDYDLTGYSSITINVNVATFGTGANNAMMIEYSTDGGTNWSANTYTTATPTSSTYIAGGPVAIAQTFSTTTRLRFSTATTSGRGVRIQALGITGVPAGSDTTPPTIVSRIPAIGATNVTLNPSFSITFSEAIAAGAGSIQLFKEAGASDVNVPISSVNISGATATFTANAALESGQTYYVLIASNAITDTATPTPNAFAGISSETEWTFTTLPPDTTGPVVTVFSPLNGATSVNPDSDLVVTFDENLLVGSGNILIKKVSDNSTVATLDVTNNAQVIAFNNTATLNPSVTLPVGTALYVEIPAGAFTDSLSNPTLAIGGSSIWSFTTRVIPDLTLSGPYTQSFTGFSVSNPTLPDGWSLTGPVTGFNVNAADQVWGLGTGSGLRGGADLLGFQHTGSTGILVKTLSLVNATGAPITELTVSYTGRAARLTEARKPAYTVVVAGSTVTSLGYSTADGDNQARSSAVTGLSIAPGAIFSITWTSDTNVGTTGSRSQIGVDEVSVSVGVATFPPTVSAVTLDYNSLTQSVLDVSSEVTSDGGAALTARGFVYSPTASNSNPEIGGTSVTQVTDPALTVAPLNATISGLSAATNYSIRSFATNAQGTTYSSVATFTTLGNVPSLVTDYSISFDAFSGSIVGGGLPAGWKVLSSGGVNGYAGGWGPDTSSGGLVGGVSNPGVLGYQHVTSSAVATVTLSLKNDTGNTLTQLYVSYLGRVSRATESRAPEWTVSVDGTPVTELAYSTAGGVDQTKSHLVTGLSIAPGAVFTVTWASDANVGTAGARRQIGIEDVLVSLSAPAGYSSWASANSTSQTLDLDHDNDGVSNGVEYFLGGNTDTTGFTATPGVVNTAGTLSVTWTKAAGYTGVYGTDFVVETSSTLSGAWTPELPLGVNVVITGNEVKYTFPAGTKNFARLKVTGP